MATAGFTFPKKERQASLRGLHVLTGLEKRGNNTVHTHDEISRQPVVCVSELAVGEKSCW